MKRTALLIIMVSVFWTVKGQADYYFPGLDNFNREIPEPSEFLGYEVGAHHTRYDIMIDYMKMLAGKSERVNYKIIGYSEERRPQLMLIITSPANHDRLEDIRLKHLELSTVGGEDLSETESVPLVIQLGFNVHGNEASGGEASLLAAYYLAASEEEEINNILDNSVIFIEPVLNPDGRARFASWANMNRSNPPVADPNDREHNEAWPGGRTNHYWFDLNRDWLPLSQIESRNRMDHYHSWLPNIITDHHEMGTNSTFFFEPTKKGSENPIISSENYVTLNNLFAEQYAEALDDIGHYYDSGRSFDNSYPGYGSSYGDVHGGLAILFEQASSRGLVQQTELGYDLTFSLGIKNQLFAALTTVRTALDNHAMLNDYMQRFYKDALDEARTDPVKAYIFGDDRDKNLTHYFLELLVMHNIEVYGLRDDIRKNGETFRAGQAYFVPTEQRQYKMVRTMFETSHTFPDSTFYDATAWAMAYSYGVRMAELEKKPSGKKLAELPGPDYTKPQYSDYGYVFDWADYNAARALYYIQDHGIRTKAAWDEFSLETEKGLRNFSRGSVFIPVRYQDMDAEKVFEIVSSASAMAQTDITGISSSLTKEGPWTGNGSFRTVKKPRVLMLTGDGVSSSNAGALWHFFDTKISLPVSKTDLSRFSRVDLNDYNSLILPSGSYNDLSERDISTINDWVSRGGNIIAISYALRFIESANLAGLVYDSRRPEPSDTRIDYDRIRAETGKHSIGGIFCSADLDISHPLGFGYTGRDITVYRNHTLFVEPAEGYTSNVAVYTDKPVISGFCTPENEEKMAGSSSLLSLSKGRGTVNVFVDDPVFRGCWHGTNKMLMNAVFFGPDM